MTPAQSRLPRLLLAISLQYLVLVAWADGDLTTDLVVHLALEGNTSDTSGSTNVNNGTANGAVSYSEGGVGQYLTVVTGADPSQYVSLGSPSDLDFETATDFTVSLLVKTTGGFTTDHAIISNKDWASGGNPGWIIAVNTNGSWQWNIGDGSTRLDYDGPPNQINDDVWHHIVTVHDRDGNVQLYFDGTLVHEAPMGAIGNVTALATALATDGTLGYASFPGCIDEVQIWRRTLAAEEVTELNNSLPFKSCPSSLSCQVDTPNKVTLNWTQAKNLDATGLELLRDDVSIATLPLDTFTYTDFPPEPVDDDPVDYEYRLRVLGNDAALCPELTCGARLGGGPFSDLVLDLRLDGDVLDSSEQANHGTLSGAPAYDDGIAGQSLTFTDPATPHQFVDLGTPSDLDFGTTTNFSVSVWVKNDTGYPDNRGSGGSADDPAIISNKDWNSGSNVGWVVAAGGNGRWQWNMGDGSNRIDYDGPAGQISDGQWHHLFVSHDRDGDAVLYFDGAEVARRDISGIGNIDSGLPTAVATDGTLGTVWPNWFNGMIDSVRVWRRVLGPSEVSFVHDYDSAWFNWRTSVFSESELADPSISGPLAAPFGNGVPNLLSFAQGETTPGGHPPIGPVISTSQDGFLQITYRRLADGTGTTGVDYQARGVSYKVEQTTDLTPAGWQSGDTIVEAVGDPTALGGGVEEVTVRSKLPIAGNPQQFLRFSASLP